MTLSHWQRTELGAQITCDVAVVGGGIVGASTAYWLKKLKPGLRVALIESRSVGFGASGRNAGFLLQGAAVDFQTDIERYGNETAASLWAFTRENSALIASEFAADRTKLKATGSLILAGSEVEAARLQRSSELLSTMGAEVSYWAPEDVTRCIRGAGFFGGLKVATGAVVDSVKLVREIAGRSGAIVMEQHPVYALEWAGGHVVVKTTCRNIIAGRVILCLNAYLPQLLPQTHDYIRPVRAQMQATMPVTGWLDYPVYSHEGYYYVRQLDSGSLLIGGARHLFMDEETGYEDQTTPHLQQSLVTYLYTHFPHLDKLMPAYQWSGTMALTADGLPVISPVAEIPGSYWAAGFNGHGMGYGFRFGKMAAALMAEAPADVTYRNIFDVARFT